MQLFRLAVGFVAFAEFGAEAASPNAVSWRPHSEEDMSNLINGLASEADYSSAPDHPQTQASHPASKQGALLKQAMHVVAKPHHHAFIPPPANRLESYLRGLGGDGVTKKLEFTTHWRSSAKAQAPPAAKPVESNIYLRDLETGHMDAPDTPSAHKVGARKLSMPAPTVPVSGPLREAEKLANELDDSAISAPALTNWEGARASSSHSASLADTNTYLDSVGMTVEDDSVGNSDLSEQRLMGSNPYLKALGSKQDEVKNKVREALRRPGPRPAATGNNPYLSSIVSDKDFVVLTGA